MINKIKGLQSHLQNKIRGQDHVITRVCSVLERGELGLNPPGRPKGSLMFLGPTGVGKTELALAFTGYLFGEQNLHRFDMTEFSHADAIKNFIGSESGQLGRLGTLLQKEHQGTLFFDEIEKAHHQIWDLFLQILDTARITAGPGISFDLSGFYVVFTSNLGSADIMRQTYMPFTTVERFVLGRLVQEFRPELVARIQEKLVFRKLDYHTQREIALITLGMELQRMKALGHELEASEEAVEFLVRQGMHKTLGARPMRNTVERLVGDAVRRVLKFGLPSSGVLSVNPVEQILLIQPKDEACEVITR